MSALARIKKTAAQHEQERQYDKALALYARLLDGAEAGEEEVDVALFNRAGDLALRVGDAPRAVGYFERALDLYAAAGLLNNAVALGVKILRHAPHHLSAHYTLGVLYGRKGFVGDARHHLLTYAVQMQRAGRVDETSRVLAEVAATCADLAELRGAYDAYSALGGDPAHAAPLTAAVPADAAPPRRAAAPEPEYLDLTVGDGSTSLLPGVSAAGAEFESAVFEAPDFDVVSFDPVPPTTGGSFEPRGFDPSTLDLGVAAVGPGTSRDELPTFDPAAFAHPELDVVGPQWAAFDTTSAEASVYDAPDFDPPAFASSALAVPDLGASDLGALDFGARAADDLEFLPAARPTDELPVASAAWGGEPHAAGSSVTAAASSAGVAADASGALVFLDVSHDAADDVVDDDAAIDVDRAALTRAARPAAPGGRLVALANEPPPLRLADLADVARPRVGTPLAGRPADAPEPSIATGDADGRFADLLAIELGDAAADASPPAGAAPAPYADREAPASMTSTARADAPAGDALLGADDGLDLGAWLRETTPEESTRMTTADVPQSGDEQADFDATLRVFTAGVSRAVGHEDFDSHYDLGVAFREMGLVEEAIVQFQRAAQAPGRPLRALEALGQCFLDAGQPELTLSTLTGPAAAADASVGDASLVAVHYLMGAAAQALGRPDDARRWLVRVVATDVRFRDASRRLAALSPPTPTR